MLYIVSTPIGHLEDFSERALRTLQECDAVLCEDTRHSALLLHHYKIKKPLLPYHKFNECSSLSKILSDLRSGKKLALISDAGTPCINDPGGRLTAACIEHNIPFTAIPGPCSIIQALVLSGFPIDRFQYLGFLPKNPKIDLRKALFYQGITVALESPQRLLKTLKILDELDPKRTVAVAREMTKLFEECLRGAPAHLISHFQKHPPKGELVLLINEGQPPEITSLNLEECVKLLQTWHGLSLKEAIKQAAQLLQLPKREIYKKIIYES